MKAMILAAGEGTRLRPLTAALPKPMAPIVGAPLLARTLSWLAEEGVKEAAINLFHLPQVIVEHFGYEYAGIRLRYSFEANLMGTAGGLKPCDRIFEDAPFYVIYGDNLVRADLRSLFQFHMSRGAMATMALFQHPNPAAAGIVGVDSSGRVTRFMEKPPPDQIFADTANAGIYVLDPAVLRHIPDQTPCDFGRDIFPSLLAQGISLCGTPLNGYLQDTGTPDQYRKANWDALAGAAGPIATDCQLWISPSADVHPSVKFSGRNIIGAEVSIGKDCWLHDCIVWDNATVGCGAHLDQAIIGLGATIREMARPERGAILA